MNLALMTMGVRCYKDYPEIKPTFEFTEKLSLLPYKKVYAINDTMWIQFQTTDKSLFDKLTGRRIATDIISLEMIFHYYKRYPNGLNEKLFSKTTLENPVDVTFTTLYIFYNVLQFNSGCSYQPYFFRAGFVLKKPGVFSIDPKAIVTNCTNKIIYQQSTFKFTFDLADCNKDVWLSIAPTAGGGSSVSAM